MKEFQLEGPEGPEDKNIKFNPVSGKPKKAWLEADFIREKTASLLEEANRVLEAHGFHSCLIVTTVVLNDGTTKAFAANAGNLYASVGSTKKWLDAQ